jgi:hypothetical protein
MPLPSYTYSGAVYSSPSVGTATFNLTTSGGSAIGFLDPSHIRVYTTTDGGASLVERFRPAQWDFNTARTQVTLVVPTVANEAVVIRRITPITGPLVDVPDGITLPAQRLRDLNLYSLYVTQEQYEVNAAALTTAQEANTQVAIAINSIASQLAYTRYANRAAVPTNPGSAIAGEILDSTNMQTFAPLTGVPSGFVGSASLIVRIRYNTGLATWQWIDYRAADADARYLLKTQLVDSVGSSSTVDPPTAKAVKTAFDKGATAQTAVDALAATVAVLQTANASQYTVVADVASIPTGTNGLRIEITNSTNIQSFSPLTGRPSGFIGSALLSVRLTYSTLGSTWQWIDYKPVDPDGRYAALNSIGRNRIINGNFAVLQRGNPFSTTGSYGADRWFTNWVGGGNIQFGSTTTAPTGFRESGFINHVSGTVTDATFVQRIESANCKDLVSGGQITISFWAFTNKTGGWTPTYDLRFPTAADNYTATTAIVNAASLSAIAANTWTKLTATVTLSGTPSNGLELTIHSGVMASGENRLITGVQLEPGPVATPFEQRPIGTELALCQRYFQWAPFNQAFYAAAANAVVESTVLWPVPMRTAPTVGVLTADPNTSQSNTNNIANDFLRITAYGGSARIQAAAVGYSYALGYRSSLSAEL